MEVSVVIPAYRSARILPELTARLLRVLDAVAETSEVIFVEDGSPDDTWQVLRALQRAHPGRVVAIQLMRNYGQHNALMCGFRRSCGRYVVTMDDDLQHPPEEVPKLLAAIRGKDLDLVYGCYRGHKKHLPWRNLGSEVIRLFYRVVFGNKVSLSSFRVIRRELLESIFPYNLNFTYVDGLLAWNTYRIGEVSVEHRDRAEGKSGYSMGKLVKLGLNLFTNFSLLPLQMISTCGLLTALGGLLGAVVLLVRYFMHQIVVPGYASTMIAVLVLGGVQLLSLGIMGEYLGRLHLNVNRKPQYVVRQELDDPAPDGGETTLAAVGGDSLHREPGGNGAPPAPAAVEGSGS